MAKIWDIPFANAGDKQTIPVPAQPDGTVSTTQGWTPDYELPNTNPAYKPVGREEMNGALFEVTESIQQLQLQGAAEWSPLFAAYQKGAEVIHSGERWRSLINGNTEQPGTGSNWLTVSAPLPQASIQGNFKNLKASATGTNATVSITVDELVLENSSNNYQTVRSVSVTPSLSASGVNGLDTGTSVASTWYAVWVIWNGTTIAGLLSLSHTSPVMPSGYTHRARVGWVRSDGTANKFPLSFIQFGRTVRYKMAAGSNVTTWPQMASTFGTTPFAVGVSNFVPVATAAKIAVQGSTLTNSGYIGFAPNAAHPIQKQVSLSQYQGTDATISASAELVLESSNIYSICTNTTSICCFGWEDNL